MRLDKFSKSIQLMFLLVVVLAIVLTSVEGYCVEPEVYQKVIHPIFQKSCVKCHGENGKVKGKVDLFKLKTSADLAKNPDLITDIIDNLEFEAMPPESAPPLKAETRELLVKHLKEMLHKIVTSKKVFSQTPIRRMNRFQYSNAVQDLFQLNVIVFPLPERMMRDSKNVFDPAKGKMPETISVGSRPLGKSQMIEKRLHNVTAFPQDLRAENGFDNRGDHLSLSPLLMESFMNLARSIVNSNNFDVRTVGIWNQLFVLPKGVAKADKVLVRERLSRFLTKAFRRPVSDDDLNRYTAYVMGQIESGTDYTTAVRGAAAAAIASPKFLYIYDKLSAGTEAERLDNFELATRMSFFLWGSIPDEELLSLAASGKLQEPDILSQQVDRMLKDKKLKRFCDSFPVQWLQLERIISSTPDKKLFKDFYFHSRYRASMHMMLEPLLLFETILIEDRPITDFIDSDFSYRSGVLTNYYQPNKGKVPKGKGVSAIPFQRVQLTDRREGGIITNAAVMTMTSSPTRTQPITRGSWLITVIFNDPPPPPPADVPLLEEKPSETEKDLTIRERLAKHRENETCAGCHNKIDPLGFALENYDVIGRWRDKYENGRDIDSYGELFRKHKFTNIIEFKDAILAEKDRFARGFAKHLLSFSLGREVVASDSLSLDKIVDETIAQDYRIQSIIKQIVLSDSFQHKFNPIQESAQLGVSNHAK